MELSKEEVDRYKRHISIPDFGLETQTKLKTASVLVVGAGGLGSPVIIYLAAAGIGKLGIIDHDKVSVSNLQRQILYKESDIGESKSRKAAEFCQDLNHHVQVEVFDGMLLPENAEEVINQYDVIVDAVDSFSVRYLINRVCVSLNKPLVHGAIHHFDGEVSVFNYQNGPCYECLYPSGRGETTLTHDNGVFGVLPGVIGTLQATEVIKVITGNGDVLNGKLLLYDAMHMGFNKLNLKRNPDCKICGS